MIKFEHFKETFINPNTLVTLKKMNHIFEITHILKKNKNISIKLIDKDHYLDLKTGCIEECNHIENRSQNLFQVGQSLKRLRDLINSNISDVNKCKWVTLTYRDNMTDTKKLYNDFKNFIRRFKKIYSDFEYIVAMEPQARGAWHCHCIFIFDYVPPFIPNKTIEALWRQGFTKITKLDNLDNVGAYLTAYLGDLELSSDNVNDLVSKGCNLTHIQLKNVSKIGEKELETPKSIVKGGRLYLYPPKFNIYRCSRGIKKPQTEVLSYYDAKEKVGNHKPTYTKTISLISTDTDYTNSISYEYYNTKRI